MNIGKRLKEAREKAGESQKDVAAFLGTTQNYISRYENGKHDIPAYRLALLCKRWHISADHILGLDEE